MAKKRKLRVDRLIILILSAILIIGLLGLGIFELINLLKSDSKDNKPIVNPTIETSDNVNVSLVDYDVYIDDANSVGFNFIVAELSFTSNDSIDFNLNDLQTSEKLALGSTGKQLEDLAAKGYRISKLDVVNNISSQEKQLTCKVFIPYTTDSAYLNVFNAKNPTTKLSFDLSSNQKNITSLKFDTDQEIKVGDTNLQVSSSSISTMMEHNGEEYNVSSTSKVFTFKIYVDEVKDNVSIVDAYFIKDNSDTQIKCMSSEYNSVKVNNILGKTLTKGENGALFFEVYSLDERPDYAGCLMLKLSNQDEWVKISTSLE